MANLFSIILCFFLWHQQSYGIHQLEKRQLVTCPGFAGYCSEAYPGGVCTVVCAFGRPNVPECQPDGTWTDVPRCIEHEPGKPEQIPGQCPGIPGYCSDDYPGGVCEFDCLFGPDIRSFCTPDGTWEPYPVCQGDIRETRDGCKDCPGPFGGPRNRTAEALGGGSNGGSKRPQQGQKRPTGQAARPKRPQNNNRPSRPKRPTSQAARPQRPNNQAARPQRPSKRPSGGQNRRNQGGQKRGQAGQRRAQSQAARPQRPAQRPKRPQAQSAAARPQQKSKRPQGPKQQSSSVNRKSGGGTCPGGALEMCIDVCPSFSARIFGACVAGCAKRCPTKK